MTFLNFILLAWIFMILMLAAIGCTVYYHAYVWDGDDPDWMLTAGGYIAITGMYSLGSSLTALSFMQ